jgi:hypothetical protein
VKSRLLLNAVLTIAAIALAAYLFLVPPAVEVEPLTPIDAASFDSIRIEGGTEDIRLLREGDRWRMVSPYSAPIDTVAVDRILSRLPPEVHRRYEVDELDLTEVGLDPAAISVTLDGTATASFAFGDNAPGEGFRYLLAEGAVYLATDGVFFLLSSGPMYLLDKRLAPGDALIDRLELPGLTLTRGERGWDRLPDDGAASDADQALIDRWSAAQAINISAADIEHSDDLSPIVITRDDGEVRTLWVDMAADDMVLHDLENGLVYEMPAGSRSAMLGTDRAAEPESP